MEESTTFKTTDWLIFSKGTNNYNKYTQKWRSAVNERKYYVFTHMKALITNVSLRIRKSDILTIIIE